MGLSAMKLGRRSEEKSHVPIMGAITEGTTTYKADARLGTKPVAGDEGTH
jgi:hypothetical protein